MSLKAGSLAAMTKTERNEAGRASEKGRAPTGTPEQTAKKRTRPVSACEACRAKKVKCLLLPDMPVCENCKSSGKQCLFRVDDLAPKLRQERFSAYGPPGANARVIGKRQRSKSRNDDAAEGDDTERRGSEDPTDTSVDMSTDAEGRKKRGKAKSVFRSFANPSHLAAPSLPALPPAAAFSAHAQGYPPNSDPTQSSSRHAPVPPSGPGSAYPNQPFLPPQSLAEMSVGYSNQGVPSTPSFQPAQGAYPPPNHGASSYPMYASQYPAGPSPGSYPVDPSGYAHPPPYSHPYHARPPSSGYMPPEHSRERPGPSNFRSRPSDADNRNNAWSSAAAAGTPGFLPVPSPSPSSRLGHQDSPKSISDFGPYGGGPSRRGPSFYHHRTGSRGAWHGGAESPTSEEAAAAASRSQLYDTNPKVAAGVSWNDASARTLSNSSERTDRDPGTVGSAGSPWPQSSLRGGGESAERGKDFDPLSPEYYGHPVGVRQTSHVRDTPQLQGLTTTFDGKSFADTKASPQRGKGATQAQDSAANAAKSNPEDAPIGSSAAEAEILSRKLQWAVTGQAERMSSSGRSVKSVAGESSLLSESVDKASSSGFRKIALPFFRWFGVTANTPGFRRIKVGVYHEPMIDVETVPNQTASAPGASGATPGADRPLDHRAERVPSQGPLARAAASPASDIAMAGEVHSPRVGHAGESTLSTSARELFEPSRPRYPRKDLLLHLIPIFMSHFRGNFFPWLDEEEVRSGAEDGKLPALLANVICAIAARFSPRSELRRGLLKKAGDPFSDMAKILIMPMLSWPSLDIIEALVMLSYAEFGAGSDSGLWMYGGMALRMAQDLGLQHEDLLVKVTKNEKEVHKARLLFWSVVAIDRITCFGTGRPVTIREDAIDTELPPIKDDMVCEQALFGHTVRILLRRGAMGELLNRKDDDVAPEEKKARLGQMWVELARYYQTLPNELQFNVQTFKRAIAGHNGPAFVYLHVLFQSTISLLHRPILQRKLNGDLPAFVPEPSFAPIASSASRTIADILSLADALDDKCLLANPYLDQLVLPAGRSFLGERNATREALKKTGYTPGNSRPPSRGGRRPSTAGAANGNGSNAQQQSNAANRTNLLLVTRSWAETNLATCQSVLDKIAVFWGGAGWPARALEAESHGSATEDVDPEADDDDAQNAAIHDVEMVLKWAKERVKLARSHQHEDEGSRKATALENDGASALDAVTVNAAGPDGLPQGFGISGLLDAEADFDLDALLNSWGAVAGGGPTPAGQPAVASISNAQSPQPTLTPFSRAYPLDIPTTARLEELFPNTTQNGDDVFPLDLPQEDLAASSALFGPMMFSQDFFAGNPGKD